jgi:hypothetical protein
MTNPPMILKKLDIEYHIWGEHRDKYTGLVEFFNEKGRVQVNIGPEEAQAILEICAQKVVSAAKETAAAMIAPVLLLEKDTYD